jgi:hypothetical protein
MDEPEELDDTILVTDARIVPAGDLRGGLAEPTRGRGSLPAVQAAAAAAGGFVAGAAVYGIVYQRRSRLARELVKGTKRGRSLSRRSGRRGALPGVAEQGLQILSSHTLLLDVHVLGTPDADG